MIKKLGQPAPSPTGVRPHFSSCVAANGLIFTSGQMAFDKDGKIASDNIHEQTAQVLANIEAALALASARREHIVKTMVWLTDPDDFPGFNDAYREFFPSPPPARSTVCSALMVPGALIEIEAIAVDPTRNSGADI